MESVDKYRINEEIEYLRQLLNQTGLKIKRLTDPRLLRISNQLETKMMEYYKQKG